MKRTIFPLIILLFVGMNSFAQKKNGTIYLEHENIDKTKALWNAVVAGDIDKYLSFFADSLYMISNGEPSDLIARKDAGGIVNWWKNNTENLEIRDNTPAFPDALDYKNAGVWVQDWLLITARHKKSGINIELPLHNLYSFNKEGKITAIFMYFNNDIFEEITNNLKTEENGKIYINHPYIIKVRKLLNSMVDKDLDTWKSFFTEKATFESFWMEPDQVMTMDQAAEMMGERMGDPGYQIKIEQRGYPDCIYYDLNGYYVVYSWWDITEMRDGKKVTYPVMFSHSFNNDGKIFSEMLYAASNHCE